MAKVARIIDSISDWSGKLFGFLVYPGVLIIVYEVVVRYAFDAPTIWAYGTSQRIFAVYFVIGGAYALLYNAHIRVDVIYEKFSLRTRMLIDILITTPLLFAICFVLLWHGGEFAWDSLSYLEVCDTPFHAPVYPVKVMVPLAGLLLLLQGLASLYRYVVTLVTGKETQ